MRTHTMLEESDDPFQVSSCFTIFCLPLLHCKCNVFHEILDKGNFLNAVISFFNLVDILVLFLKKKREKYTFVFLVVVNDTQFSLSVTWNLYCWEIKKVIFWEMKTFLTIGQGKKINKKNPLFWKKSKWLLFYIKILWKCSVCLFFVTYAFSEALVTLQA